ncbi:hypothetical protein SAMN05444157_2905 [Frankineae bacterium MT45]|nr:hypothetical protein SAMN05444157_2905 [Frankineae bacterium MT45]
MTSLDLLPSWAKMRRAAELLAILEQEVFGGMKVDDFCTIETQIDPDTGWVTVVAKAIPVELRTPILLGEFVHDLRCSLDYIVTALADQQQVQLLKTHQFPIAETPSEYAKLVKSWLKGIANVPPVIDLVQPYHYPDPSTHPLALLNRLSNADKHRSLLRHVPTPESHKVEVQTASTPLETTHPVGPLTWDEGGEVALMRLRFAKPYPTDIKATVHFKFVPWFAVDPFPPDFPDRRVVDFKDLRVTYECVRNLLAALEPITPDQQARLTKGTWVDLPQQ